MLKIGNGGMNNPSVSVIAPVFRPGGIDLLLEGMRAQTYTNFEVILVDRRYEFRAPQVKALAKEYGLNLIHAPEYRRNGKWISFCSGFNTGLALARGEVLIFLGDWMCPPAGWIEQHLRALDGKNRYVAGAYQFLQLPNLKTKRAYDFDSVRDAWLNKFECVTSSEVLSGTILDELDVFESGKFTLEQIPELAAATTTKDLRIEFRPDAGPGLNEGWLHIKNDSIARSTLMELNGFEERLERGRGPLDIDIQIRLAAKDVEFYWDPAAWVYYMDPHYVVPTLPYGSINARMEGRWCWLDGLMYVQDRKIEIALGKSPRAKNPFDINERAKELENWRVDETLRKHKDMTDLEYFGFHVWPDSP